MLSKHGRIAAHAFFALLWLGVVFVGLELLANVSMWWTLRHNPYIAVAREAGTAFPDFSIAPPAGKPVSIKAEREIAWFQNNPSPAADWEIPVAGESDEHMEQRRRVFPRLNEVDRCYFATIHSEMICQFDKAGGVKHRYGNWMKPDSDGLIDLFRRVKQQEGTHYAETELHTQGWDSKFRFYFLLEPSDKSLYAFIDLERLRLLMDARALPPDSPWEVPYFRYKKNLRDSHSGMGQTGFSTNNFGFLGPDIVLPKDPRTFRILCIGGSTTEEGKRGATYPELLEQKLRALYPGRAIEVINCGVSGMTTTRHVRRMGEYLQLQPDLLVLYEGVNDICHDLPAVWRSRKGLWGRALEHSAWLRFYENRRLYPPKDTMIRDIDSLSVQNLAAFVRAARKQGVRSVICGIAAPDMSNITREERQYFDFNARTGWENPCLSASVYREIAVLFRSRLKDLCRRERILYVPVEEEIGGGLCYFGDFCHMKPAGIERKAEVIAAYLKEYIRPALDRMDAAPVSGVPAQ